MPVWGAVYGILIARIFARLWRPIRRIACVMGVLAGVDLSGQAAAMTMESYDIDSVVFMSTDIVLAKVEEPPSPKGPTTFTVIETIHGAMPVGLTLNQLGAYLSFFYPTLEPGQQVVLFLDRRPRERMFLAPSMEEAPYAIVPSGIYLVDDERRVHNYQQLDNPGPYVAVGYLTPFERAMRDASKGDPRDQEIYAREDSERNEQNSKLPTYESVARQIEESESYVERMRPLLERKPTSNDGQELLKLVKTRSDKPVVWDLHWGSDRLAEAAIEKIRELRDLSLSLDLYPYAGWRIDDVFQDRWDPANPAKRTGQDYLLGVLGNKNEASERRVSAAKILQRMEGITTSTSLSPDPTPQQEPDPFKRNKITAHYADRIHDLAQQVIGENAEPDAVRIACLRLTNVASVGGSDLLRKLDSEPISDRLRFAVDSRALNEDDAVYENLPHSPGAVATIVELQPSERFTIPVPDGKIIIWAEYYEENKFYRALIDDAQTDKLHVRRNFVLTNRDSGARTIFKPQQMENSGPAGTDYVMLDNRTDLAVGDYDLTLEYAKNDAAVSHGYPLRLRVVTDGDGKMLQAIE